jgi:hypothetical protein
VNDHPNLDGEKNYVIVEVEGRGHYVGVTHNILQNQGDWWGEGDEMIFIDDKAKPYISMGRVRRITTWVRGATATAASRRSGSNYPHIRLRNYGNPVNGGDNRGAKWMVYRFHTGLADPVPEYFKMDHRARPRQTTARITFRRGLYWLSAAGFS